MMRCVLTTVHSNVHHIEFDSTDDNDARQLISESKLFFSVNYQPIQCQNKTLCFDLLGSENFQTLFAEQLFHMLPPSILIRLRFTIHTENLIKIQMFHKNYVRIIETTHELRTLRNRRNQRAYIRHSNDRRYDKMVCYSFDARNVYAARVYTSTTQSTECTFRRAGQRIKVLVSATRQKQITTRTPRLTLTAFDRNGAQRQLSLLHRIHLFA